MKGQKMTKSQPQISKPNQQKLELWLEKWEKMENYRNQESALNKLFHCTYPKNVDLDEILVKVATLNDFYSTHIFNLFVVAKHIMGIKNLDERLKNGDEKLVDEIAKSGLKNKNGKEITFYSFATKFCSHHNDEKFAIYDSYVEKVLLHFKNKDKFSDFKRDDLKNTLNLSEFWGILRRFII